MKKILLTSLIITLFLLNSCSEKPGDDERVVIAIAGDVTTFNPLFTVNYTEGLISEQIYPGLVHYRWNDEKGGLDVFPMLAENWQWNDDSTSITLFLRKNVFWHDSVQFTANDVVYTYDLYSDPEVNSKFYGIFENYFLEDDESIDLEKSFEVVSDHELKINFPSSANPDYFDFDFSIVPRHIFEKVDRADLMTSDINFNPVGTGAYKLKSWRRNEAIVLQADQNSFLYDEEMIDEIIFKIVPDYNSRVIQLEKGEVDLMQDLRVGSVEQLAANENLVIDEVQGREFEYIGWNNIDPVEFAENGAIKPHKLFGDKRVRKALTYAINRVQIVEEFLKDYGKVASGPVSEIFKEYVMNQIKPYEYNIEKAEALLSEAGWEDKNNNGIIEKDGTEFAFMLHYVSGNPLREFAANIIKNDLSKVGIDVEIMTAESAVFFDKMFRKNYDAWIAGWVVPIPIDLKPYWHSNLQESFPNVISFQNAEADKLLEKMKTKLPAATKRKLYTDFQEILFEEQPVTFLYWKDNIVVYNKRISNISVSPLGAVHHCWEWRILDY